MLPFSSNKRSPSSIDVVASSRDICGHEDLRQIDVRHRSFVEHLGVVAEPDRFVCELHRFLDVASPREHLRAGRPPQHLRDDIVAGRGALAHLRDEEGLVDAILCVERLGG